MKVKNIVNSMVSAFLLTALFSPSFASFAKVHKIETTQIAQKDSLTDFLVGAHDEEQKAIERSLKEGAGLQYVLYSKTALDNSGIDQIVLSQDINDFVTQSAGFFKENHLLKGTFYAFMTLYPSYDGPYQIPLNLGKPSLQENINNINAYIKENSSCNEKKFCSLFLIHNYYYVGEENDLFDGVKYKNYMAEKATVDIVHYPTNKKNLKPIVFVLMMGTNGKLLDIKEISEFLNFTIKQ